MLRDSLQVQLEESQNQAIQNEQAIRQDEKQKVKKEMLDAKVLEYMTNYKRCTRKNKYKHKRRHK